MSGLAPGKTQNQPKFRALLGSVTAPQSSALMAQLGNKNLPHWVGSGVVFFFFVVLSSSFFSSLLNIWGLSHVGVPLPAGSRTSRQTRRPLRWASRRAGICPGTGSARSMRNPSCQGLCGEEQLSLLFSRPQDLSPFIYNTTARSILRRRSKSTLSF